jgi:hypothetical protein
MRPAFISSSAERRNASAAAWKDTEVAWLAGLFDGEGCVWSRWPKRANVIVEIKMTHRPTLERVNEIFPGRLVLGNLSRGALGKRDQWRWSLDTNGARDFLTLVLPYLVTKREEARIALELCRQPERRWRDNFAAALKMAREAA